MASDRKPKAKGIEVTMGIYQVTRRKDAGMALGSGMAGCRA